VAYLAYETDLVYGSVASYVWGVRTYMKLQRQFDPAYGVVEYDDLMSAAAVVTWVASEPRAEIPLEVVKEALERVDATVFWEVQAALAMLFELHSFARSESIVAGALTGPRAFDQHKNLMVEDMQVFPPGTRIGMSFTARACVGVRLKGVKQDPRIERPEARGNADWVYIGDVDEPALSVCVWVRRFFRLLGAHFRGPRDPKSPLFLHRDMVRPYTYDRLTKDYRELWSRAPSCVDAAAYGSHSLRVAGYNGARRAAEVGPELAVAQGGWHGGEERYARFRAAQVLSMPGALWSTCAAAARAEEQADALAPPPRVMGVRLPLGSARAAGVPRVAEAAGGSCPGGDGLEMMPSSGVEPASGVMACGSTEGSEEGEGRAKEVSAWVEAPTLPPGWEVRCTTYPSGRVERIYRSPAGAVFRSRRAAVVSLGDAGSPVSQADEHAADEAVGSEGGVPDATVPGPVPVGDVRHQFPVDLDDYVLEKDRPSRRRPPVARGS